MITLVANTITKIISPDKTRLRYMIVSSDDITNIVRLGSTEESLTLSTGGFAILSYNPMVIALKPGEAVFAVSAGTPNISIGESYNPVSALRLS